jgi:hypothetical protein
MDECAGDLAAQALTERKLRYRSVDESTDREPIGQARQPLAEYRAVGGPLDFRARSAGTFSR